MQRSGLEWVYRLGAEPKRLWRRYLTTNFAFLLGAVEQLLRSR
jgi:N-acetylglucosaminyldiphosphoundecaprenol N-acetyl-beta-D-mannosaminyltransferase